VAAAEALEANRALVLRYFLETHTQHHLAVIDELLEPTYAERIRRWMRMERAAFPDGQYVIEDVVAEGDKAVLRWTYRATHLGEFRGRDWVVPATGRTVTPRGMLMYQVRDGQRVAEWLGENFLDFSLQLGATLTLPAPRPSDRWPRCTDRFGIVVAGPHRQDQQPHRDRGHHHRGHGEPDGHILPAQQHPPPEAPPGGRQGERRCCPLTGVVSSVGCLPRGSRGAAEQAAPRPLARARRG
jgi:predicted ester cyclase